MSVILPNLLIWTSRSDYSTSTGTSAPTPYLSEVRAHGGPISAQDYRVMPEAALTSDYLFKVDVGTDAIVGDAILKVTRIDSVYTPWDELGANEAMTVIFAQNSTAGPLSHRKLWCKRITAGGPAQ
jgi:hypothetical protein